MEKISKPTHHIDYDLFVIDSINKQTTGKQIRDCLKDAIEHMNDRINEVVETVNLLIDCNNTLLNLAIKNAGEEEEDNSKEVEETLGCSKKCCKKYNEQKDEETHIKKKLVKNAIKCLRCGDVIESKSRHDYVRCSCGKCAVDGGHEYQRIVGNYGDWELASEWEEEK